MWTTVASVIALIAAKILGAYWLRKDVTDAARYRVFQEMQVANDEAGKWKNVAWADPARAAALGVLPSAKGLRLDGPDDPPSGSPAGSSVS